MAAVAILGAFLVVFFAGLAEAATRGLWVSLERAWRQPGARLTVLWTRMAAALVLGVAGALATLARVFGERGACEGQMPSALACAGHGFGHGPGIATSALLLLAVVLVALAAAALFRPLPAFPAGEPVRELEQQVRGRHGLTVRVERLPDEDPGCVSEVLPEARILLLGEIRELLGPEELEAVLAHEAAHFRLRDHLTRILARAVSRVLFVAGGSDLLERVTREQERRADDAVVAARPELAVPLARALVRRGRPAMPGG